MFLSVFFINLQVYISLFGYQMHFSKSGNKGNSKIESEVLISFSLILTQVVNENIAFCLFLLSNLNICVT